MARFILDPEDLAPALVVALQHPQVLAALRAAVGANATPAVEYATVTQYAQRQSVCSRTVQKWIRQGLPSHKAGRLLRVNVARADAWLEAGGAAQRIRDRALRDVARSSVQGSNRPVGLRHAINGLHQ
jgi:excisionase family DNA binding protein